MSGGILLPNGMSEERVAEMQAFAACQTMRLQLAATLLAGRVPSMTKIEDKDREWALSEAKKLIEASEIPYVGRHAR